MAPARTSDSLTPDPAGPSRTRRLVLIVVLGVLVGAAGFAAPHVASAVGAGGGESAERAAAVSRASDFATVYNTYDVSDLEEYQQRMEPLLTEDYYTEFTRVTGAVFEALESKDQSSGDADVLGTAVQSIDEDSAVVLVAVDASITTAADEAAVERRFRWKVTLTREGDEWLVSQFETVTPLDATTGAEGEEGSPDPADPDAEPAPEDAPTPSEEEAP